MKKILWPVLALLALGGCVGSLGGSDVDVVRGSLGDVDFNGSPEVREVRIRQNEIFVDLRIEDVDHDWAAMIGLTIPRGEDLPDGSMNLRTEDAEIIGCSGREDGEWDFDCHPDDYFVDAYGGKDDLRLEFEGTFTDEGCRDLPDDSGDDGQSIDGSVDVDLI